VWFAAAVTVHHRSAVPRVEEWEAEEAEPAAVVEGLTLTETPASVWRTPSCNSSRT
jgi:hypothetical protein